MSDRWSCSWHWESPGDRAPRVVQVAQDIISAQGKTQSSNAHHWVLLLTGAGPSGAQGQSRCEEPCGENSHQVKGEMGLREMTPDRMVIRGG